MRVVVLGQGYVGITAAVGLASAGHHVVGVDRDPIRLQCLQQLRAPISEPGLDEAMTDVAATGRLCFCGTLDEIDYPIDAILVAVGSPPLPSGGADTTQVEAALAEATAGPLSPRLVMLKSSVPPGTSSRLLRSNRFPHLRERYVYSPEFLNQGTALRDWSQPHRIVLGVWQQSAASHARDLFSGVSGPYLVTEPTEAEAIKYVSNAFLATRVSFANEIARLCEFVGADVTNVLRGVGLDPRIGELFWQPGIGYGDSCLPKDLDALIQHAATYGQRMPVLESVQATNRAQHLRPLSIVREECAQLPPRPLTVAVLGVAYEPHSDDIRAAPSRSLIPQLAQIASTVAVWDPQVGTDVMTRLFPFARRAASTVDAVRDADIVLVLTEYCEVVEGRWAGALKRHGEPVIVVDAKNCLSEDIFDPGVVRYRAIGKPRNSFPLSVRTMDESRPERPRVPVATREV